MCKKAQEYLRQLKEIDGDILNMIADAERWRLIAMGTTARSEGDRVQSSGSQQRMADAVCEYISIEEDIKHELGVLANKRKEIIGTINMLPYTKRNVLHKRYVQDRSFDEISLLCDKSRSWVTSVHGRALQDVQAILDERERNVH
jgi:DNA-directed RNA polymerase specialized sigma24 family protein